MKKIDSIVTQKSKETQLVHLIYCLNFLDKQVQYNISTSHKYARYENNNLDYEYGQSM